MIAIESLKNLPILEACNKHTPTSSAHVEVGTHYISYIDDDKGYQMLLYDVDVIFLPIILNSHFHLVILDKVKKKYMHYSLAKSHTYDANVINMVITIVCFSFLFASP